MMKAVLALGGALTLAGCVAETRVTLLDPAQPAQSAEAGEAAEATELTDVAELAQSEAGEPEKVPTVAVLRPEVTELDDETYDAIDVEETALVLITQSGQQARIGRGAPRVRVLSGNDRQPPDLISDLPLAVGTARFGFEVSATELSEDELDGLVAFLNANLEAYRSRYLENPSYTGDAPGLQIEIGGYTDSSPNRCNLSEEPSVEEIPDSDSEQSALCNLLLSKRRAGYAYYQLQRAIEANGLEINMTEDVDAFGAGESAALEKSGGQRVGNDEYRAVWVTFK